jgi:hypothetical protein
MEDSLSGTGFDDGVELKVGILISIIEMGMWSEMYRNSQILSTFQLPILPPFLIAPCE